jgi:hypothetical protein
MTHAHAVNHLRQEVCGTARYETGRLIDPQAPAFFGAVRGVMCDLDYVAALYAGWDGANRRHIATTRKSVRFLREVMAEASGEAGYDTFAETSTSCIEWARSSCARRRFSSPRMGTAARRR